VEYGLSTPLSLETAATSDVAARLHWSALGSFMHRPTGSAIKSERRRDVRGCREAVQVQQKGRTAVTAAETPPWGSWEEHSRDCGGGVAGGSLRDAKRGTRQAASLGNVRFHLQISGTNCECRQLRRSCTMQE
jgi:hypothetical protein